MAKNKNSFIERLKSRYVFSVRNDDKFLESVKATLSVYELVILFFVLCLVSLFLSFLIFKYSSLNHFFTSYTNQQKKEILFLNNTVDSLENKLTKNDRYYSNINRIISGRGFTDGTNYIDSQNLRAVEISDPTVEELALREKVQEREQFTLTENTAVNLNFSKPIDGIITNSLDVKDKHFGVDLVAPKNTPVQAAADGIIIYSSWSEEDGHILIVNHENDFITVYKHNEKALKSVGERVQGGDAIAIIGNGGENTSGYHLHFEMWQNGIPKNPTDYISLN